MLALVVVDLDLVEAPEVLLKDVAAAQAAVVDPHQVQFQGVNRNNQR